MPARALLFSAPVAAVALALLELTRLPAEAAPPARLLASLGYLVRSAASSFLVPALVLGLTALALVSLKDRARLAALIGLGVAQSALAREVLIEYPPFAHSLLATAGFVLAALALAGLHVWLGTPRLARHRRAALGVGLALAVACLAVARAHYVVYVGQYPTLHLCVLQLCFVGLTLGLALAISAREARVGRRGRAALVAAAACLAVLAVLELPSSAWARPVAIAYTELGRAHGVAQALDRDRDHLLPSALPSHERALAPDDDGRARFERHSGLPEATFAFSDFDALLVLVDATRFDRTSLARPDGPTPALARLAQGAQTFTRAYAPSNGTFPSVAAMLAMAPVSFAELDVEPRFWRGRLREGRETAAEAMRAAGRRTFWVGHDHEGCFSRNIAGLDQGFETVQLVPEERGEPAHADVDARIADLAIAALPDARHFGLVFFVSPHDDYRAREDGLEAADDEARYDAELAYFDAQLARLLAAVDLDETVVIVAGDHGEAFGERGHRHHLSSVHAEQVHVPLVVHVPGMPPAVHEAPTSTAYVLPWLLLRGEPEERAAAERVLREDIGPMLRATDGAVVSEMIGQRRQEAALAWPDRTVIYDVFADLVRVYDPLQDPMQRHDLREARPALYDAAVPLARAYRRVRFDGRRFRFIEATP